MVLEWLLVALEEVYAARSLGDRRDTGQQEDDVTCVLLPLHLAGNKVEESIERDRAPIDTPHCCIGAAFWPKALSSAQSL